MALGKDRALGRQFRTLFHLGAVGDLSDGQLLERFANSRGEAAELAFAALVERHGAMVLRVCRAILDDPHDSDDAFQATFLVLVAKGRSLWVRDSLGPWLHQVATRTARCARATAARRQRLERAATLDKPEAQNQPEPTDEVERVLLEEIHRLPERFKAPVVLCDLEGQTHEAAARALGWPIGTVKSRQARARERLRERLTRRGFAPVNSLALLALPRLGASIPTLLVNNTARLAVRFVATRGIAPGSAVWLAQEVIRSMTILRSVKIASVVLALGAAGSGAGWIAQEPGEGARKKPQAQVPVEAAKAKAEEKSKTPEPPVDETVFQVKPGKLELTETERGALEPSRTLDVISEVQGATTIISIKPEGANVTKGEVVCELDSAVLRDTLVNQLIAIQQAEAAFKQAKLVREVAEYAVKEYLEGLLPAELERLKEKIAEAERGLKEGESRLERTKTARKKLDEMFAATKGPATPSDIVADATLNALLETAERSLADHKRDLELARKDQEILDKFTSEKTTRKLRFDLEEAKAQEVNKLGRWDIEKTKQTKLERQIERCVLRAPGDGMVVYANQPGSARLPNGIVIEEGATVRERQKIFRVINLSDPLRVNAKFSEALVDQIKVGGKATIKVDAFPNQTYTGTVISVAPMADPNALFQQKIKVYTTLIGFDEASPALRPGMSASTTIVLREVDNVLTVPAFSLIQTVPNGGDEPRYQVQVRTAAGKIELRDVVLGMSGGSMVNGQWVNKAKEQVEVKEGLKAGDIVLRRPRFTVQ